MESFSKKGCAQINFFDQTKAFDIVNHNITLEKLWRYDIKGCANELLSSYLKNQQQLTETKECNEIKLKKHFSRYNKRFYFETNIVSYTSLM